MPGRPLDRLVVIPQMWRQEDLSQSGGSRGGEEKKENRDMGGSKKPRELPDLLWGMRGRQR